MEGTRKNLTYGSNHRHRVKEGPCIRPLKFLFVTKTIPTGVVNKLDNFFLKFGNVFVGDIHKVSIAVTRHLGSVHYESDVMTSDFGYLTPEFSFVGCFKAHKYPAAKDTVGYHASGQADV